MISPTATNPAADDAPVLVGREREQALLARHLASALAGRGSLVLVGGEAGIGKTALAEALATDAASQGALVLVGRCYHLSETPPYGPWVEAFERLPAAHDRSPLPAPLGSGDAPPSQAALFARSRDFLTALAAERPLVLLLDDLHWADPASLELLRALARTLEGAPTLLLATYRADELTRRHPLAQLLPALVREARAARLDLRPLDDAAVRALVQSRYDLGADGERLVAYLGEHAEGNPFYLGELLRTLEEEGLLRATGGGWALGALGGAPVPALLRQVIEGRLARLGAESEHLLAVAAVIGQEVPLALWAAVGEVEEEALLGTVEPAVEARVLEAAPDGASVRFAHALIREVLYAGTLPLRRRGWHLRAGEGLAAAVSPDPDAVAYHLRQAGDPRAIAWLIRAGERAHRGFALRTAAARYEAALALADTTGASADRGLLLYRLASAHRMGDVRRAVDYVDEARREAAASGDRALEAYAERLHGQLRCFLGEIGRGVAAMAAGVAALESLPADEHARLRARFGEWPPPDLDVCRANLALWQAVSGRYVQAAALAERVLAREEPGGDPAPGDPARADALAALGYVHAAMGRPGAARRACEEARAHYRALGDEVQAAALSGFELNWAVVPYQADQPGERRRLREVAEGAAQRAGAIGAWDRRDLHPRWFLATLVLDAAWAEVPADPRIPPLAGHLRTQVVRRCLAPVLQARGERAAAWALVRDYLPDGPASEPGDSIFLDAVVMHGVAAALALEGGDLATARRWLECHARWLAWGSTVRGQAEGHLGWAAYCRAAGDLQAARRHAEQAFARAVDPRQPLALLAAHRLLGELATEVGRHTEAREHLGEALALADACAAPFERALTLLALAELRRATGDRAEAQALLDEVRGICAPLDAKPALARAEALVAKLTSAPLPPTSYPGGLSAREAEVLRLVAAGLSNAQVAARLFISPATVNSHLTAIYGKLGVPSRGAAIRFALDHGLR